MKYEAIKFAEDNKPKWSEKKYPLSKEYKEFLIKLENHLKEQVRKEIMLTATHFTQITKEDLNKILGVLK